MKKIAIVYLLKKCFRKQNPGTPSYANGLILATISVENSRTPGKILPRGPKLHIQFIVYHEGGYAAM